MRPKAVTGLDGRLRVLIVDDSEPSRRLVAMTLVAAGFIVDEAADARGARQRRRQERPDVVVLDVELPDASGFDLLREIVGSGGAPVLMLTERDSEDDRVLGLELGADDYIIKPFFPRELAARVRIAAGRKRPSGSGRLNFPGLSIDITTREIVVDGRLVELTPREFDLLAYLAAAPHQVFSRETLLRDVWHSSPDWQTSKTVTEHVRRIRHKIDSGPDRSGRITSVAGAGYRFDP